MTKKIQYDLSIKDDVEMLYDVIKAHSQNILNMVAKNNIITITFSLLPAR